ncbi:MAG TPA: hypothetical protein VHW23_35465 [Kofleriaceae bacterium]|jgi:hypothetical protein|nr:hypothetical protein [Kofleriaceae bacterium]
MYDLKQSSSVQRSTSSSGGAGTPGKQTLTSSLPPAPASASATPATAAPAPAAASTTPAAPAASPVPPEVLARVGAEFLHTDDATAERHYRITPGGGFLLIASSDGKPPGKLEFRSDNKYREAWSVLCAYVVKNQASIPPTAPPPAAAPPTATDPAAPAAPADPAAPAADPWSLQGAAQAIGNGLASLGSAAVGAVRSGIAIFGGGAQAIEDAIASFFGAAPTVPAPGATTPGATTPEPGTGTSPAPGSDAPKSIDKMPAMSQFRWYNSKFQPLGVDEVLSAAQIISKNFGLGGEVKKVTTPADADKANDPNDGFWWFHADGTPTWDGTHGTQYVTFTINKGDTSSKLNPVSAYLAENPPNKRPPTMPFGGKTIDVPADVQSLDLRNIPGPRSCFATSAAMMAQAGAHAIANDLTDTSKPRDQKPDILPVTGETYREYTDKEIKAYPDEAKRKAKVAREVIGVTCDPVESIKAKTYIDFELDHGRPVFTGITYKESDLNDDGHTDHWVVISGRAGAGAYTFNNPADGTTGAQFVWDGEKLNRPSSNKDHPEYLYVVSWIRPNVESLQEWATYWAQHQPGAGDAAAPKTG